jgi:WD40 repeat protein
VDQPVLSSAWSQDGRHFYTGGSDKKGLVWDVANPDEPGTQFAHHNGPIKEIQDVPEVNWIATGGWDKGNLDKLSVPLYSVLTACLHVGRYLVTPSAQILVCTPAIRFWDLRTESYQVNLNLPGMKVAKASHFDHTK